MRSAAIWSSSPVSTASGGRACVAFCNEHGKLPHVGLPENDRATALWEAALNNRGNTLRDARGTMIDWLVGPVLVLYGDDEFMAEL